MHTLNRSYELAVRIQLLMKKKDTMFRDFMKSSKPISLISADSVDQLFKQVGPIEYSPEAEALENPAGFSYRAVLGELM